MHDVPAKYAQNLREVAGISHGFFGRQGGVSRGTYSSLNAGIGSDDNAGHVRENRARIAATLSGSRQTPLLSNHQIHSTKVAIVTKPWETGEQPQADAMVTKTAGIALSALSADCSPVLFCDPVAGVIGAAHAGWRGALAGVTDTTIEVMENLGAKRANIIAAIGPCLSMENFEVGPEFVTSFLEERQDNVDFFVPPISSFVPPISSKGNKQKFDIKTYLRRKLLLAGVKSVDVLPECTYAAPEAYFSYRYNCHNDIEDYGRNISVIMINV